MPAGCEFTCMNEDCEHYKAGFVLTGSWPLGRIELVIEDPKVKENAAFREELLQRKKDGFKYVCITYPNNAEIPCEGYRVQLWCDSCKCIWNHDVMLESKDDTLEKALQRGTLPTSCNKCNSELKDFQTVIDGGIPCPHCGVDLQQNRWISKEG